jgi:hypothetical protein
MNGKDTFRQATKRAYPPAINLPLLEFWQAHARPGRIGLLAIRFPLATLIAKAQAPLTADGKPSRWVHAFIFQSAKDNIPWILESDIGFPRRGIFRWTPGTQENPVTKWCHHRITHARVLEADLTEDKVEAMLKRARELVAQKIHFGLRGLLGTWLALRRGTLEKDNLLHARHAFHCAAFVRLCLLAAGADPLGPKVTVRNTAPEHLSKCLRTLAEWP